MATDRPDAIILGCVKLKVTGKHAARDLYASALWRYRRAYAERSGLPWFIFSAKHGLLQPETLIASYDVSMADLTAAQRDTLGTAAVEDLDRALAGLRGKLVEIHAGARYRDAIEPWIMDRGGRLTNPLAGMSIGRQLQWYAASASR